MALGFPFAMDPTGKSRRTTDVVAALGTALMKDSSPPSACPRFSRSSAWAGIHCPAIASSSCSTLIPPVTMNDVEPSVRIWAHMAVMAISDDISEQRLSMIAKILAHSDPLVRIQAGQALGRVGAKARLPCPS